VDEVFAALVDVRSYPLWWPQVRSVDMTGVKSGLVVCKAFLPIRLALRMTEEERDQRRGFLRIGISGDLEGFLACEVTGHALGARLDFQQEVEARKPIIRNFSLLARPIFAANHAAMMRSGQRGLRGYLGA
jgi:hypothetical protein